MNLLATTWGRLLAFFLLYVTEGLPLGFAAGAVSVWMRRGGVGVEELGWFIGMLYAPWSLKWLFGPIVDLVGIRRIGRRRSWILGAQLIMIVGLLASSSIDYVADLELFAAALFAVFGVCAVQDVAIDALAVATLKEEERGIGNGLMFGGAAIGQALGGAGMLYLASVTGSVPLTFVGVAAMVGVVFLTTLLFMREDNSADLPRENVRRALMDYGVTILRAMLASRAALAAAVFAILPASAMALGLALSAALSVEVGLTDERIATLSLISSVVSAAGSVVGGWVSDRIGHRKAQAVYALLVSLPTAWIGWVLYQHGLITPAPDEASRVVAPAVVDAFWYGSIVYSFFVGLTYGTRMAIFMHVCDAKVAATQFTAYMAASNFAITYTSWWQGIAAERWGFPTALWIDAIAGLACLLALPFVSPRPPPRA